MQQLTQNLKSGRMQILEVPFPVLSKGNVLVRNHYSVISPGTEGKKVKTARSGYLAKIKGRPKDVALVMNAIKSNGLLATYQTVMNKLDMPAPLGYSCAGEVIGVGREVTKFKAGDWVACGGAGAVHAEIVSVAQNLCVKIPPTVDLKLAAFTTIAAIAMQGIRQADLRLGESCVIIGLGLVGQLTVQLLNAAGVKTIAIDLDHRQVELAKHSGAHLTLRREEENLTQMIGDFTHGFGADAVVITAATLSRDPVELAGALCRKKGKVIIVGDVPTGFSREPYYKKELELRMSCSYGPGRYDAQYEDKGIDYPLGYVRWTENRNMQAFVELLQNQQLDLESLITHTFEYEQAEKAYHLILDKTEPFVGILLKYNINKETKNTIRFYTKTHKNAEPRIGFIGAGSFAQKYLLPVARQYGNLVGVATATGNHSRNVADKYGFQYCTGNPDEIIADEKINTVFIATRHHLHAEYVLKALQNGKNVFVEKPLCLTAEDLEAIKEEYERQNIQLMVGFNRRFAPHIQKLKERMSNGAPCAINLRINAGAVAAEHWVQDREIGGGRIIGEVCHFVDLASYLAGAKITSLAANVMDEANNFFDTLVANLTFANGSIAAISYFANGNKALGKEYLEVFTAGRVAILDDFKKMAIYDKHVANDKLMTQDKGHTEEIRKFLMAVKEGGAPLIPFEEIYFSTLATLKISESVQKREMIFL